LAFLIKCKEKIVRRVLLYGLRSGFVGRFLTTTRADNLYQVGHNDTIYNIKQNKKLSYRLENTLCAFVLS